MQNVWFVASAWMGIAFLASLISIRLGVSAALIEILLGVVAGNAFHIHSNEWISFLATFGAGLLTFLAGAEIDPQSLRSHLKESMAIGIIAFLIPFLGVLAFTCWLAGWTYHEALIAGIALSTTSVAVVYAVLVENGLSQTELGKMILAACFINDFGTVLALGVFFANFNRWMVLFVVVMAVILYFLPSWTRGIIKSLGETRVSEPEVKFLFLVLFFLGGLATMAKSEAVLPAYLAGLVVAGVFLNDRVLVNRMRSIAFTMLTPFYFIKAGLYVSLPALILTAGVVVILLGIKC
jgi:Kef-type K+ transport system membrane component KefB